MVCSNQHRPRLHGPNVATLILPVLRWEGNFPRWLPPMSSFFLVLTFVILQLSSCGTYKVKYQPDEDWDFYLDVFHKPADISLALPHYRARNQPIEHRMNVFVGGETSPMRIKVVCPFTYFSSQVPFFNVCHAVPTISSTKILPRSTRWYVRRNGLASFRL